MLGDIVYQRSKKIFRVGDIVTTYHKGYHRVISCEISCEHGILTYQSVLSDRMTKTSKRTQCCDVHYCNLVDKNELIEQLKNSMNLVEQMFERSE